MPKVTYDANIFIHRKPANLPAGFYMSIVVLQELLAGAPDESAVKELAAAARREYKKLILVGMYYLRWFLLTASSGRRSF